MANYVEPNGSISARSISSLRWARAPCRCRAARKSRSSAPPMARFYALVNKCPHKAGPLSQGIVHDTTVTCPLHNWRICLMTGEALGEDKGCVPVIPVKVDGGRILIGRAEALAGDGVTPVKTTCAYCGVGCGIVATPTGERSADDQGRSRSSGQSRQALLQGHASGRNHRARRAPAPSRDRRRARRLGHGARPGRQTASPRPSPNTARTASPSTSRASC